jgi:hypothetical protein
MRIGRREFLTVGILARITVLAGGISKPWELTSPAETPGDPTVVSLERFRDGLRVVYDGDVAAAADSVTVTVDGAPTAAQFEGNVTRGDAVELDVNELHERTLRVFHERDGRRYLVAEWTL